MKKYFNKTTLLLLATLLPVATFAAGLIPCDGVTVKCDFNAFSGLINGIINWFLGISVSVAAITFAIAGAKMLLNPNSAGERQKAIEMFKKTVIGMIIILGAWLVIHTVIGALVNPDTSALRFLSGQ